MTAQEIEAVKETAGIILALQDEVKAKLDSLQTIIKVARGYILAGQPNIAASLLDHAASLLDDRPPPQNKP